MTLSVIFNTIYWQQYSFLSWPEVDHCMEKGPWGQLLGKPGTWKYSFWRLIPIFSLFLFIFESSNIFKILVFFFIWPHTLATFFLKYMLILNKLHFTSLNYLYDIFLLLATTILKPFSSINSIETKIILSLVS